MGDRKFTLLELHLNGDFEFAPKAIKGAEGAGSDEASEAADEGGDPLPDDVEIDVDIPGEGRGNPLARALVSVGTLAAILFLVRRLRSGEEDETPEPSVDESEIEA